MRMKDARVPRGGHRGTAGARRRLSVPPAGSSRSVTLRVLVFAALLATAAPAQQPVQYTVALAPAQNSLHVTAHFPRRNPGPLDIRLPVWNALYQVRDFAQYVTGMRAGGSARIEKIEKSTWRVYPAAGAAVEVSYSVFCDRGGAFGAEVNAQHAFINPAQVLVYTDEHRGDPVELRLSQVPAGWRVATALPDAGDLAGLRPVGVWRARNYDHLADSPIEVSAFREESFSAGGGNYRIVVHANDRDYSMHQLRQLVERIVTHQTTLMRDVPFQRFTFLYHFAEGLGGGMEHAESTAIHNGPMRSNSPADVTAHEFFHLWNVKRIRPRSLEPVDYTREQYTRALWFSEGVTSTIAAYTLLRTGLNSRDDFLKSLADGIRALELRPARLSQSVEEASLDAWLEKYSYYNGPQRSISYYNKGELVGVLLDLALREATGNRAALEDVLRLMNEKFAKREEPFNDTADIQAAAEEVAGRPLQDVFDELVRTAAPLNYNRYLGYAGYRLKREQRAAASLGFAAGRGTGNTLRVSSVDAGGPAAEAGVHAGDEIVEVNGRKPFSAADLTARFDPGDRLRLRLRRNGRDFDVRYRAGQATEPVFSIESVENPSLQQQVVRQGWLGTALGAAATPRN